MSTKGESELVVLREVYRKLSLLQPAEQARVLEWVIKRLNEDNGKPLMAAQQPPQIARRV